MNPQLPLLGLLARGDAYGYDLKRTIKAEFAPHWQLDFAQLYRSLGKLEAQGLVQSRNVPGKVGPARKVYSTTGRGRRALEKWLQQPAQSDAEFWVKLRLATALDRTADLPLAVAGSDDPLLSRLVRVTQGQSKVNGSTAGLVALAQEQADLVGAHLREPEAGGYNVSFIKHLLPEHDVLLVNLALRDYGLMVASGNPRRIRSVKDLARGQVRLMNRPPGSGARQWLGRHLTDARLDPVSLAGWASKAPTYEAVGEAILSGAADVGPGLRAVAVRMNLDFVPIGQERFDLVLTRQVYESKRAVALREALAGKEMDAFAAGLPGYDLTQTGRVIARVRYGTTR